VTDDTTDLVLAEQVALTAVRAVPDLGELTAGYVDQPHLSLNTRAAYRQDLQQWLLWCHVQDLHPIQARRLDVERWVRDLQQVQARTGRPYSAGTVARRLNTVRGWYGYLVDAGVVDVSPAERVKGPKVPNVSPLPGLALDQAQALLTAAQADPRDAVVVGLLLHCGLRASEVGTLNADGLQAERGHVTLTVAGKGGRRDRVPLPTTLAEQVTTYLDGRTTGPLVTDPRAADPGARVDRYQVARLVARVCRAAGVPVVSPHNLRHATVTLALQAGAPLHRVQDLARHADPATTRRYDRAAGSLDGHAAYVLGDYLVGAA
jgi:site-specific recombinase XerD